jgi:hypothetical protein
MLEGGKERVHLLEGPSMGILQALDGLNPAGKLLLKREGGEELFAYSSA